MAAEPPSPAQQNHHGVSLGWDEAQQEDVAAAAVVALQDGLAQGPVLVQSHLLALGSHQVVHDVAASTETDHSTDPQHFHTTNVC